MRGGPQLLVRLLEAGLPMPVPDPVSCFSAAPMLQHILLHVSLPLTRSCPLHVS